jgi:hypothetical protein
VREANAVHQARGWQIDRIAPDFRLLDVWVLPVEGSAADFDAGLRLLTSFDPTGGGSLPARALFWIRFRLGELFGWDDGAARPIPGCSETTLRDRLPDTLRQQPPLPDVGAELQRAAGGFVPVYRTDDEWAGELSNATVHGVLHLSWVEENAGHYRGRMAVYVKPRGRMGEAYLRLIDPFRHLVVYPALMRHIGRTWEQHHPRPVT